MDRVQYHLERLLPSLQLISHLSLFSPTELRALTHTRKQHETSLVTPAASPATFLQYIAFEVDVEKLLLLRIDRAGKDPETGDDRVTIKDRGLLRRGMEKHIISIWQRLIAKKGRKEPEVYSLYLDFLQGRKMRRIYAQVAAQGLSMHPNEAALWIRVADWELNTNLDASAARITLLRGIRLNASAAMSKQQSHLHASSKKGGRRKRRKLVNGASNDSTPATSSDDRASVPLTLQNITPPVTRGILDLWTQYFRMELVFLERLRRRWAVLGIGAASQPENNTPLKAISDDDDDDDEDTDDSGINALRKVRQGDEDEEDGEGAHRANASAEAAPPTKVLSGVLPLAIFTSALALNSHGASPQEQESRQHRNGSELPLEARMAFILSVTEEIQRFPFANLSSEQNAEGPEKEDGELLRSSLLEHIRTLLSPLAETSPISGTILALKRQGDSLRSLVGELHRQSREETRSFLSEQEQKEEERKELAAASVLRPLSASDTFVDHVQQTSWTQRMGEAANVLHELDAPSYPQTRYTEEYLLSHFSSLLQTLIAASSSNSLLQSRLAKKVKTVLDDLRQTQTEGSSLVRMKVIWTIWRVYAYISQSTDLQHVKDEESSPTFAPFEIGVGALARQDPLLPFLTLSFQRACQSVPSVDEPEAQLISLVFEYQKTLHKQSVAKEGEEGEVSKAWDDLLNKIAASKKKHTSSATLERCFTHIQARSWASRTAWKALLRESTSCDEDEIAEGLSFWSNLLNLPSNSSSNPYTHVARRTFKLFLLWCLTLPSSISASRQHDLVKLLERIVCLTRVPLISSSSSTLEDRQADQEVHDEALFVFIVKSNSISPSSSSHKEKGVGILSNQSVSSPSLQIYFRLLDFPVLAGSVRKEVYGALEEQLRRSSASFFSTARSHRGPHQVVQGERKDLLEGYRRIFHSILFPDSQPQAKIGDGDGDARRKKMKNGDVRRGIELLNLARRAGRGEEAWESQVELVWREVCALLDEDGEGQGQGEGGGESEESGFDEDESEEEDSMESEISN